MLQSTKSNLIINNAVELGDNISVEDKGKGRHFTSRFIEAGLAHYQEFGDVLITKETLDKFIYSMVGCPVIIRHKDITAKNVDKERVGVVSKVWYNELDGWFWCEGIIWDKQAIDLIKNQGWSVSCTYDFESDFKKGTYHGKEYDMEFTGGEFLHLALVDNPRYERANIVVNSKDEGEDEKWITVHGNHVLIDETPNDLKDFKFDSEDINKEQGDALYNYFSAENVNINGILRGNAKEGLSDGYIKRLEKNIKLIDSSMKNIPNKTKLLRIVKEKDLCKLLNVDKLDENIIGKSYEQKGYTSTTDDKNSSFFKTYGDNEHNIIMKLTTEDIKGISLVDALVPEDYDEDSEYKDIANEKEILLQRNTFITITEIKTMNDKKYIYATIANKQANNKGDITMTVLNELKEFIQNVVNNKGDDMKAENEKVDKRDIIRQIMAIAGKEETSEDVKTIAKLAEKLAYDSSEDNKADNKAKNEENEEKEEKFEEEKEIANKKAKNEEDEEKEAENKCKNEEEEVEEKEEEEKAENKCKNSMDETREIVYGGSKVENMSYIPISKRIELGNNY